MIKKIFLFILSIIESFCWFLVLSYVFDFDLQVELIVCIFAIIIIIITYIIVKKLRDYEDNKWSTLLFLTSPVRLPLMIISIPIHIILLIFVGYDNVDFSADSACDEDDTLMNLTSTLFMFSIDDLEISERNKHSKLINLLTLIFYFVPFTILQLLSLMWLVSIVQDNLLMESNIIIWFLKLFFSFIVFMQASIMLTKGRCQEEFVSYFDRNIRVRFDFDDRHTKRMTDLTDEDLDYLENNTNDNKLIDDELKDQHLVRTNGGWKDMISSQLFFTMLFSPINIFLVLIAIIIACFSSNKKKLYCWYGTIDYSYCKAIGIQKILHFLFYFVILSDQKNNYSKEKKKKAINFNENNNYYVDDGKVSFMWFFLGYGLSFYFIVGFIVALILLSKGGNKKLIGKKILLGVIVGTIINLIFLILLFKYLENYGMYY